jgi:sulfate adenylyltransferase
MHTSSRLIPPYGQVLQNKILHNSNSSVIYAELSSPLLSLTLNQRQLSDIELILNGGFSPLQSFLTQADYLNVLEHCRLADNTLWPMPIMLDVQQAVAEKISLGQEIALLDAENILIAIMTVSEKWQPDKTHEAISVYGTTDKTHPGVNYLFHKTGDVYLSGSLRGISLPVHYDFCQLRKTPLELRALFQQMGWERIVGFQTRNPMHRAHKELTLRAAELCDAKLLLNPSVGLTKPGDIDHFTRVRCYEKLLPHYPEGTALLNLLPLAMRMAGPREALWHAIIRQNYGCSHFIVGRDHAGPGKDKHGKDFYDPYAAQEFTQQYQAELGIKIVPFQEMVYVKETEKYEAIDKIIPGQTVLQVSGTEFRHYLQEGLPIPHWFSYDEIINELRKTQPAKHKRGLTIFFTGLSGAGKSTIANALIVKFLEIGDKKITLLDGDLVRQHLSSELGFSKEHRDLNVQRIGFVAAEIAKHGGVAICAPIAPYEATRHLVRELHKNMGNFFEIYISTPLEICELRDRKGLYKKARAGILKNFTGIDDPYELPLNPELTIDTSNYTVAQSVELIFNALKNMDFIQL